MREDTRRRYDAHVRVNGVCAEHSALFDTTPGGQKTHATLDAYVANEGRLLAVQARSIEARRAAANQAIEARRALRIAAKAIVKVGKLVNLEQTTMATMQLPRRKSDDQLIADAQGLIDHVSAHIDAFVAEGLPGDVLKNLDASAQALAAAKEAMASARHEFAAATAAIRKTQDEADTTVAALQAIASTIPAAYPEVVTKLRIAGRVGSKASHPRKRKPATDPAPPPTSPTSPAA